jgi:hypothetical protein
MIWYIILNLLLVIFAVIAGFAFIVFVLLACMDCEGCEILLVVMSIFGLLATGAGGVASVVEDANTTIKIDTVQMEVTDCKHYVKNGIHHDCCITLDNVYVITMDEDYDYAKGDIVTVEITTETRFGVIQDPVITLKQ